jgi:dihydroxyacetone kinase-like predicted kinase
MAGALAQGAELDHAADAGLGDVVSLIASCCSQNALGNSGIILAEYIRGMSTVLDDEADVTQWAYALKAGASTAREALLAPEDGTILTVADAAAAVAPDSNFSNYFLQIQIKVREALTKTQFMLPQLQEAGVVDAGAVVLTLLHDSFAAELGGSALSTLAISQSGCEVDESSYDGPQFELMFSFTGSPEVKTKLQDAVTSHGDSISFSGGQLNYNFHIHTDDPENVVAIGKEIAEIGEIRIQELRVKKS